MAQAFSELMLSADSADRHQVADGLPDCARFDAAATK